MSKLGIVAGLGEMLTIGLYGVWIGMIFGLVPISEILIVSLIMGNIMFYIWELIYLTEDELYELITKYSNKLYALPTVFVVVLGLFITVPFYSNIFIYYGVAIVIGLFSTKMKNATNRSALKDRK